MNLKDFKKGSYSNESFDDVLKLFVKLEALNMFDCEMLTELKKMCMGAIQRQVKELVKVMPYNAQYSYTGQGRSNHWAGVYKDKNLELDTSIFYGKRLSFSCDNILKVENDRTHCFNVNCIVGTQTELKNIVDELLNIINEEIKE